MRAVPSRWMGVTVLALWTAALGACGPRLPAYHVREVRAPPPSLPAHCGDPRPCEGTKTWVVFYSTYCASCHRLLEDLARSAADLERHGVCVATYLVDAGGCPEALRVSRRSGDWPVAPVGEGVLAAWGVDTAPVLYMMDEGEVRLRVQGRGPVQELLRLARSGGAGDG